MSDGHEGFIKTPKQLIIAGILALIVPVSLAMLGAYLVTSSKRIDKNESTLSVEQRIRPVGTLVKSDAAPAATAAAPSVVAVAAKPKSGEEVYNAACTACHGAGVAGAPKTGDKAAWSARIAQGAATLYKHSIEGFKGMPAKGGQSALSDDEVKAAVDYLVAKAK